MLNGTRAVTLRLAFRVFRRRLDGLNGFATVAKFQPLCTYIYMSIFHIRHRTCTKHEKGTRTRVTELHIPCIIGVSELA